MTIINNSAVAEESKFRVHSPILLASDPVTGKPITNAQWFFGLVGLDPQLEKNQKKLYALQEDNSSTTIPQPAIGATPSYNGSPVSLAISGAYSLKILDEKGDQKYYFPKIEAPDNQGFSGVIIDEKQTVVGGNLTLTYQIIEATTATFLLSKNDTSTEFKGSYLEQDKDYTIDSATQITLLDSGITDGYTVIGRQADPTGQVVPVSANLSDMLVGNTAVTVVTADLKVGDTITLNGKDTVNDGLGGTKYITVTGGTGTADGENYIDLNNGNQLELFVGNNKFGRYTEKTNVPDITAGTMIIDLNKGQVNKITLSEDVTGVSFINVNPDTSLTSTVSIKITQNATAAKTVTFPANIKWALGVVPTITADLSAYDRYVFMTDDGGATWDGMVSGQDFK